MNNSRKTGHAYKDGKYLGLYDAEENIWVSQGWTVGEAPEPDPEVIAAARRADMMREVIPLKQIADMTGDPSDVAAFEAARDAVLTRYEG